MRSIVRTFILIVVVILALSAAAATNQNVTEIASDITPEKFIQKLTRIHAANPYTKIAFDFSGKSRVEGAVLFFRIGDDCDLSGSGEFTLSTDGKLVVKAADVAVSCGAVLKLAENVIGAKLKDHFALPDLEKMAAEEPIEFIALSPAEAALYAGLGVIEAVEPGHAVALGAHRDLVELMGNKFPLRTRREIVLTLQKRYPQYFEERRAAGHYTTGALAVRVDMDWASGRFRSAVLRYPWGEPRTTVTQTLFERRWVWQTVELWLPYEDRAWARVSVKLSNYRLR